ncbi:MAG: methyltransferase domain-containing protein [Anaerolineae bacterium]
MSLYLNHLASPKYLQAVSKVYKHFTVEEFPFIVAKQENPAWSPEVLRQRVHDLGTWEYYFPFSHGITTQINSTFNETTKLFHRYRSRLISETIIDLLGDDAKNSTALDLACHCGVMSLDLAYRGVRHAHGIEWRQKNVDQAQFLRDYYQIANTSFVQGDVYEIDDFKEPYDVVMCLGILYHVVRPVDLVEYCYRNCKRFAVIDTNCHKDPISAYIVVRNKNVQGTGIEGTRSIEFQPTYRAVVETMLDAGFKEVIEVVATCDQSVPLYNDGTRCCFIGFK